MGKPKPLRVELPGCGDFDDKLDRNGPLEVDVGEELVRLRTQVLVALPSAKSPERHWDARGRSVGNLHPAESDYRTWMLPRSMSKRSRASISSHHCCAGKVVDPGTKANWSGGLFLPCPLSTTVKNRVTPICPGTSDCVVGPANQAWFPSTVTHSTSPWMRMGELRF